jgi:hypothetical protein
VSKFKDAEHLIRLAVAFVVVLIFFVALRQHFIPKSFGQYGHYRGDALAELSSKPVKFAGHKVCADCHSDVVELKKASKHAGVNCEACHGPQSAHAADPGTVDPQLPDTAVLCVRCHEANLAKPKGFPQVVSVDHSSGVVCKTCHVPHSPLMVPGAKS